MKLLSTLLLLLLIGPLSLWGQSASDTTLIKTHLHAITKTVGFRHYRNLELLNQTADYLHRHFALYADTVYRQTYWVEGREYQNVVCAFGSASAPRIVVGAHYDVCGDQEGADDNASGTVGLLELARMLKGKKLKYRIELVAYTLEEPPYFRTENMGSYVHAKSLATAKIPVYGMISLEMIGYFRDEPKSQRYPLFPLAWVYGKKGDYITLVQKFKGGKFVRHFSARFKASKRIKTHSFKGPKLLPGVDFSDHLNYWKFGISALMITDTAFYRNHNYHQPGDRMESLDIGRMAQVIDGVYAALLAL